MKRLVFWLPPVLYMVLVFHLSAEPDPLPDLTVRVWDKVLHTVEYALLAALFCRAVLSEGLGWRTAVVIATVLAGGYGATDEWHQVFVPGRESSTLDWIADASGSALGAVAYVALLRAFRLAQDRDARAT